MKKLIFPLLLLSFGVTAQYYDTDNPYVLLKRVDYAKYYDTEFMNDPYLFGFYNLRKQKQLNIKEVKFTETSSKGKTNTIQMKFNSAGRLISSHNPSLKYELKAEYIDDTLQSYQMQKKKNTITELKTSYISGKKAQEEKLKNGKRKYFLNIEYNEGGKITRAKVQKKKKEYTMKYFYDKSGQLTKNEYFIGDKLKKKWNYECKPEGELIVADKNELISSKCEYREESNDGSFVLYIRTLNNGKPYLKEEKFTSDSVKYEVNYFKNDTMLIHHWEKDNDWFITTYYNKNKLTHEYRHKYNKDKQLLQYRYFLKNKLTSVLKNTYDSDGNCVLSERFNPKYKKPVSRYLREYNPNGTLREEKRFYKGKMSYTKTFEYVY